MFWPVLGRDTSSLGEEQGRGAKETSHDWTGEQEGWSWRTSLQHLFHWPREIRWPRDTFHHLGTLCCCEVWVDLAASCESVLVGLIHGVGGHSGRVHCGARFHGGGRAEKTVLGVRGGTTFPGEALVRGAVGRAPLLQVTWRAAPALPQESQGSGTGLPGDMGQAGNVRSS